MVTFMSSELILDKSVINWPLQVLGETFISRFSLGLDAQIQLPVTVTSVWCLLNWVQIMLCLDKKQTQVAWGKIRLYLGRSFSDLRSPLFRVGTRFEPWKAAHISPDPDKFTKQTFHIMLVVLFKQLLPLNFAHSPMFEIIYTFFFVENFS